MSAPTLHLPPSRNAWFRDNDGILATYKREDETVRYPIDLSQTLGQALILSSTITADGPTVTNTPTDVLTATVALSTVNIKNLRATPIELVAAPGALITLELVSAALTLTAGADVLGESDDNLAARYATSTGQLASDTLDATGFIDSTIDVTASLAKSTTLPIPATHKNQSLVLHNTGDGEYEDNEAEDATMSVITSYRKHPTSTYTLDVSGSGHVLIALTLSTGEVRELRLRFIPTNAPRYDYIR
jgi:hypothetical protein